MAEETMRFNMWMPVDMRSDLDRFAGKEGRSSADVIRQLVAEWVLTRRIEEEKKQKTNQEVCHGGR